MIRKNYFITVCFYLFLLELPAIAQVTDLDYFIDRGIKNSPVLNDINNQVRSTSVDSLLVKAGQKPQVSYNGLLYYAPVINGTGYSDVITNISNITSVVYVSQKIFNQKTIDAQYSKFGIQNQSFKVSSKITRIELIKAITLQYLSVCSFQNDIKFTIELLESSKEEETILKQLVEKGLYRQVDYSSFMVELKAQELFLRDLKIQYQKESSALNLICGINDTIYTGLKLPEIRLKASIDAVKSTFFNKFIVDSLRLLNEKLLIDRSYKPSLNWFSDAGLLINQPHDAYKNFGFSVGVSLIAPIYDGRQRKLNYDKLKIAENTRENYSWYFKQQFNQQLQQLYTELNQTEEIIPEIEQQLSFADSIIKQDRYLLNTGNISITDYVTALKNYISIKHNLNQYQIKIFQIRTEINYWNQ